MSKQLPSITMYLLGGNDVEPEPIPLSLIDRWARTGEDKAVVPLRDVIELKNSLLGELEQLGRDIELAERVAALVVEKMRAEQPIITCEGDELSLEERLSIAKGARQYLEPSNDIIPLDGGQAAASRAFMEYVERGQSIITTGLGDPVGVFQHDFQARPDLGDMRRRHVRFDVHGQVAQGESTVDKVHEALREYMNRVEMAETRKPSVLAVDHPGKHWEHGNGLAIDVTLFNDRDAPLEPIMEPALPDDVGVVAVSRAPKPDDFDRRIGYMYFDDSLRGKADALMTKFKAYLGGGLEVLHIGYDDMRNETCVVARCRLFRPLGDADGAPTYLLRESTAGEFTVEECK